MADRKPVYDAKAGGLQASVWENSVDGKTAFSISVSKSFRRKDSEEWEQTPSCSKCKEKTNLNLFPSDLRKAVLVLEDVERHLALAKRE